MYISTFPHSSHYNVSIITSIGPRFQCSRPWLQFGGAEKAVRKISRIMIAWRFLHIGCISMVILVHIVIDASMIIYVRPTVYIKAVHGMSIGYHIHIYIYTMF